MDKKVIIKDIKHISTLEFDVPTEPGVYVLTGANGSGKTTLLTCLLRIGYTRAFQDNFRAGNAGIDSFEGEVIYKVGEEEVSYHYAGSRWPPKPKSNSYLFDRFGYPEVRFLSATGNRLYIRNRTLIHQILEVSKHILSMILITFLILINLINCAMYRPVVIGGQEAAVKDGRGHML